MKNRDIALSRTPDQFYLSFRIRYALPIPVLLAAGSCVSSDHRVTQPPAHVEQLSDRGTSSSAADRTVAATDSPAWVYVPSPGNGAPARVMPLSVQGVGAAKRAKSRQKGQAAMSREPMSSGQRLQTDLELAQIGVLLIQNLGQHRSERLLLSDLANRVSQDRTVPASAPGTAFPSDIIFRQNRCSSPVTDLDKFVVRRVCGQNRDRYDEVVFRDFWRAHGLSNCDDCNHRFSERRNKFTIDKYFLYLLQNNFNELGIVQDLIWSNGISNQLVWTAFERGSVLMVMGHGPKPSSSNHSDLPPAIMEIRIFNQISGEQ